MKKLKRWNAQRKINRKFSRFKYKPEKFLREHKVKIFAAPAADENAQHQVNYTFHRGGEIGTRPGRILGNLRKHSVYEYKVQPASLSNIMAANQPKKHFLTTHIAAHKVGFDHRPFNPKSVSSQAPGMYVTTALTGCSLTHCNNNLSHYQPADNAQNLQNALATNPANSVFGANDYRVNYGNDALRTPETNVYMRRRVSGTFQSLSQQVRTQQIGNSKRVSFDVRRDVL
jgi:hypothetical protein